MNTVFCCETLRAAMHLASARAIALHIGILRAGGAACSGAFDAVCNVARLAGGIVAAAAARNALSGDCDARFFEAVRCASSHCPCHRCRSLRIAARKRSCSRVKVDPLRMVNRRVGDREALVQIKRIDLKREVLANELFDLQRHVWRWCYKSAYFFYFLVRLCHRC